MPFSRYFELFNGLIGVNSFKRTTNRNLNSIEKNCLIDGFKRFNVGGAALEIRTKCIKKRDVLAIMGFPTKLQYDGKCSFHAVLLIVTQVPRRLFIVDPQVSDQAYYWDGIWKFQRELRAGNNSEIQVCYADQTSSSDCLFKTLQICGLILGGLDYQKELKFETISNKSYK